MICAHRFCFCYHRRVEQDDIVDSQCCFLDISFKHPEQCVRPGQNDKWRAFSWRNYITSHSRLPLRRQLIISFCSGNLLQTRRAHLKMATTKRENESWSLLTSKVKTSTPENIFTCPINEYLISSLNFATVFRPFYPTRFSLRRGNWNFSGNLLFMFGEEIFLMAQP